MDSSIDSPKKPSSSWGDSVLLIVGIVIVLLAYDGIPRLWHEYGEINGVGYANLAKIANQSKILEDINLAFTDRKISIAEYQMILRRYELKYGEFEQVPKIKGVSDDQVYDIIETREQLSKTLR